MVSENPIPDIDKPLIGEIFVKRKMISSEQLKQALEVQKKEKGYLGDILVNLGFIDERDIVVALIIQYNLPYIAVNKYEINQSVLKLIPKEFAQKYRLIPLDCVGEVLSVVMEDPLQLPVKEEIEKMTRYRVATFISTKTEIEQAIKDDRV